METQVFFMKRIALSCCLILGLTSLEAAPRHYEVNSPDGKLTLTVKVEEGLSYSLAREGVVLLEDSPISMTLTDGTIFGKDERRPRINRKTVDQVLETAIYRKAQIEDKYNEMSLDFKEFRLIFRMYDSGAAWRFATSRREAFEVAAEGTAFRFPEDWKAYVPYVRGFDAAHPEKQYMNSFENTYEHIHLSEWQEDRLAFLPLLVEGPDGVKIAITEADLQDYPGMYLINRQADQDVAPASRHTETLKENQPGIQTLSADFAPLPNLIEQGGHNKLQGIVRSRYPFIATFDEHSRRRDGELLFPWRVIAVSAEDIELADNDLVWCLAEPQDPQLNFSWVKPGKVAWDWWNDWTLHGVGFKAGINTRTYKYYIDFAATHGIPYVILDEGWAVNLQADLLQIIPEIDLQEIIDYGRERKVGIVLWAGYWALNRDIEGLCRHFAEMGVKGFKVDFMDRDDQYMVRFLRDAAEIAARHHLFLDFHGTHKPTGLQRTWPNAINFEGVHGLEQMKWCGSETDQVTYDVTIPFVRMLAGPFDYTQGAMRNANKGNYRAVWNEPMSQGTRCRQLAEYIVFESPFNMLCDSPSNYIREPECTDFIADIPETWDETRMLDGKVAEYILTARRKGDVWYVGGMTNWEARDLVVDLSFLPAGEWLVQVFQDGANAEKVACDYRYGVIGMKEGTVLKFHLASGGGVALKLSRRK